MYRERSSVGLSMVSFFNVVAVVTIVIVVVVYKWAIAIAT